MNHHKKKHQARKIHTQTLNNHGQLPKFLDIQRFISARAFEIGALERSMNLARQASAQRSFQTLPRHLRRRAASHVVRRVPTKLRTKARFEMKNDKPKVLSKSVKRKLGLKAYKNRSRTRVLLKRQRGKKWLKTHIWHAKRTKMIDIWGYRLAKTPTEKCFRPTYRAAKHGFTLHDLSYYVHLKLTGAESELEGVMKKLSDPIGVDPCSIRYKPGHRAVEVNLYSHQRWPACLIGPAIVIWRPAPYPAPADQPPHSRTLLIQIHPATKDDVLEAVRAASEGNVEVEEALELGCLELGGPRSLEKLGRVLAGIDDYHKREVLAWLDAGVSPHVVPMGLVVGLTVDDPRLKFPPKKRDNGSNPLAHPLQQAVIQPTLDLARCDSFWDNYKDQNTIKFKKADLDKRRAVLEIPGSELARTEEDGRISMILVRVGEGWKMIVANTWTKAFFHSLIYTSARLVCLDQRRQIDFDGGRGSFPRDYGTIKPALELAHQEGDGDAKYWARKPPAKRVNYALMDARGGPSGGDPFVPDWDVVIGRAGLERNKRAEILREAPGTGAEAAAAGGGGGVAPVQAWILVGPLVKVLVTNLDKFADSMRGKASLAAVASFGLPLVAQIVAKLHADLQLHPAAPAWDAALVRVQLTATGNGRNAGAIHSLARLYWQPPSPDTDAETPAPTARELIGLVSTGRFSLAAGASRGFGAISLAKLVRILIAHRWSRPAPVVDSSHTLGPAKQPVFQVLYRNINSPEAQPGQIKLIDY